MALEELQVVIRECFEQHPLSEDKLEQFLQKSGLKAGELLMIRSTGIHEDKADMVNPGGNESLPSRANIAAISKKAIGEVAASYIGLKSLSQRLIADDVNITEFPVMPVLVQKMVGASKESAVMSGVMYSNGGSSRIQAAPGHGEYVVNSKGAVDNYYVSNQDVIYGEIRPKKFRLSPILTNGKIKLERVENPNKLQYASSLNEAQNLYLHEFGKFLEDKYQKRMDIEFVYDMDSKAINIVQARAIPEGSRKALEPSALNPEFFSKNKDQLTTINSPQVITPEVNKAAVITDKSQVIITQTIEQALSEYNKFGKDANIAGVIVQNPAPDTSHEAGVFNASAISVMQVKDIEKVKKLLELGQPIITDPQNSKIHQLPEGLVEMKGKSREEVEALLYQNNIIAKGIYASSLSSFVTPYKYDLPSVDKKQKAVPDLAGTSLGAILAKAKAGSVDNTKDLLSIAHATMSFGQETESSSAKGEATAASQENKSPKDKAQILHQSLELLSSPKIGESSQEAKQGLGYALRALTDGHKKGVVNKTLFRQALIAGAELHILLDQLEQTKTNLFKEQKDKAYLTYFNSQKKFAGLITGEGESLAQSLFNNKYAKIAETLAPEVQGESKAYLIESLKLSDYFLNDKSKANWQEFCAETCKKPEDAQKLGNLVAQVVSYSTHTKWANVIFTENYEQTNQNPQQTLEQLDKAFRETDLDSIEQAQKLIKTMESQIPLWADPTKFEGLHRELQENLKKLTGNGREIVQESESVSRDDISKASNLNLQKPLLKWNKDANNLQKILILEQNAKLTGFLDQSIKSLQRSGLYQDDVKDERGNVLQVARMFEMVRKMSGLVEAWGSDVSEIEQLIIELKPLIKKSLSESLTNSFESDYPLQDMILASEALNEKFDELYNANTNLKIFFKAFRLCLQEEFLNSKSHCILDKQEFFPSTKFAVNRATINITGQISEPRTLEDNFTLAHQNLIVINSERFTELLPIIEKQYPPLLREIDRKFDSSIYSYAYDEESQKMVQEQVIPTTCIKFSGSMIEIDKNITLRGHSSNVIIKYNPKTQNIYLNFSIFGNNEYSRWDHIITDLNLGLKLSDIKTTKLASLDNQRNILSCEVQINKEGDIEKIITEVNQAIKISYELTIGEGENIKYDDIVTGLVKKRVKTLLEAQQVWKNNPALQSELDGINLIPRVDFTFKEYKEVEANYPKAALHILDTAFTLQKLEKIQQQILLEELCKGNTLFSNPTNVKESLNKFILNLPPLSISSNRGDGSNTWAYKTNTNKASSSGPSK